MATYEARHDLLVSDKRQGKRSGGGGGGKRERVLCEGEKVVKMPWQQSIFQPPGKGTDASGIHQS